MEEFLKELYINVVGEIIDGKYVVNLDNYDEFSALYNKLEQSEKINKDSDESYFNMDEAHIIYYSDKYEIILNGDLSEDVYQLSVEELTSGDGE